jgi:hypothetical protein
LTTPNPSAPLSVRQGLTGRGVFADQPIPDRTPLIRYSGPILSYAQTTPQTLAVQIAPDKYLGASGQLDDYVNHSCSPNAGLVIDDDAATLAAHVTLIAIRDIAADEEIFFDYSTTMDEDDFELDCQCRQPNCRQRIRDFKHLPQHLKQKYAALGVVPAYNLKYL